MPSLDTCCQETRLAIEWKKRRGRGGIWFRVRIRRSIAAFVPPSCSVPRRPRTYGQGAVAHVRGYQAVDGPVLRVPRGEPLHLVAVDASEHQDGDGGDDNEHDDGHHHHQQQHGHTVAGELFYMKRSTKRRHISTFKTSSRVSVHIVLHF